MQYRTSKLNSDLSSNLSDTNDWSSDIETVLEQIRVNSVILSKEHKEKYLYLKGILRYFRVPVILISSIASVSSVGLQTYIDQQLISAITCLLSLTCGIIGSIELFLAIQSRMENELMASKDYYILSIEIFKILTLDRENRSIGGKTFLEASYSTYVKLIENSNIIDNKISDRLAHIDKHSRYILPLSNNYDKTGSDISGGDSSDSSGDTGDIEVKKTKNTVSKTKKYNFFENSFFRKNDDILRMSSVDDMIGLNMQNNKISRSKSKSESSPRAKLELPQPKLELPQPKLELPQPKLELQPPAKVELPQLKLELPQPKLELQPPAKVELPPPQPVVELPEKKMPIQLFNNIMPISMPSAQLIDFISNENIIKNNTEKTLLVDNGEDELNIGVKSDDLLDMEFIYKNN